MKKDNIMNTDKIYSKICAICFDNVLFYRLNYRKLSLKFINKLSKYDIENFTIYMSGGGAHNPLLVKWLNELLPCHFSTTDTLGISGDAKEAILFAILANETVSGGKSDFGTRKGIPSVSMGKISFPS